MPRFLVATSVAAALLVGAAVAEAQHFEGVIQQRMRVFTSADLPELAAAEGATPDIERLLARPVEQLPERSASPLPAMATTMWIKGRRMRMDIEMPGVPLPEMVAMYMVLDPDADEMRMVIPQLRQVMVMPHSELTAMQRRVVEEQSVPLPQAVLRNVELGDSVIHGVPVRGYEVHTDAGAFRMWNSTQFAGAAAAMRQLQESMQQLQPGSPGNPLDPAALGLEMDGLVIRAQTMMQAPGMGYVYMVLDIPRVESRAIPDDHFTVPADYTVQRMPSGAFQP
jgi:hypothetical protein